MVSINRLYERDAVVPHLKQCFFITKKTPHASLQHLVIYFGSLAATRAHARAASRSSTYIVAGGYSTREWSNTGSTTYTQLVDEKQIIDNEAVLIEEVPNIDQ